AHRQAGGDEFLGDDARFEDVRRRAIAAILLRYGARGITVLDEQILPFPHVGAHAAARGAITVHRGEGAHFVAERFVFGGVGEIHARRPSFDRLRMRIELWPRTESVGVQEGPHPELVEGRGPARYVLTNARRSSHWRGRRLRTSSAGPTSCCGP